MSTTPDTRGAAHSVAELEGVTIDRFQSMVRVLSNSCYVRHWMDWTGAVALRMQGAGNAGPQIMAFSCIDHTGAPISPYEGDLPPHEKEQRDGMVYYLFRRSLPSEDSALDAAELEKEVQGLRSEITQKQGRICELNRQINLIRNDQPQGYVNL